MRLTTLPSQGALGTNCVTPLTHPAPLRRELGATWHVAQPGKQEHVLRWRCHVFAEEKVNLTEFSPPRGSSSISSPAIDQQPTRTLPYVWTENAHKYGDLTALVDPHRPEPVSITYRDLAAQMLQFAAGLRSLGLENHDKVSLFSENSARWIVADQGIMMNGAVDCVRGSTASPEELAYIMQQSSSAALVVQDVDALKKLQPHLAKDTQQRLKFIVVLWGTPDAALHDTLAQHGNLVTFDAVMERGQHVNRGPNPFKIVPSQLEDIATLVYTSGTTGNPKAVMLTHGNLMYQLDNMHTVIDVKPGDSLLSLLPPWHIYERTVCYFVLRGGCKQVYTSIRKFKEDLTAYPPDYFVCVPLVLDTLHNRVMQKFRVMPPTRRRLVEFFFGLSTAFVHARRIVSGMALEYAHSPPPLKDYLAAVVASVLLQPLHALGDKLVYGKVREALGIRKTVVSGGGSLASHLDDFFEIIGLEVLNGWGLTETSPVLACRTACKNVRGSVGPPMPGTQVRVVNPDTLQDMPAGQRGLVLARGPGVMRGYCNDNDATAKVFPVGNGWFDTGDLGWRAPEGVRGSNMAGVVVLTGRSKELIVLSNGENIVIEDACQSSAYIKHIIVVGQDKRELGALVFPDSEALDAFAQQRQQEQQQQQQGAVAGSSSGDGAAAAGRSSGSGRPWSGLLTGTEVSKLMLTEMSRLNKARPDYNKFQNIAQVVVVNSALSVDDGTLTRTMKPRRAEILKKYHAEVDSLLRKLR